MTLNNSEDNSLKTPQQQDSQSLEDWVQELRQLAALRGVLAEGNTTASAIVFSTPLAARASLTQSLPNDKNNS